MELSVIASTPSHPSNEVNDHIYIDDCYDVVKAPA